MLTDVAPQADVLITAVQDPQSRAQDTACHRAEELAEADDPTRLVTAASPPGGNRTK
ncbi:hypothetical protein ACGFY7_19795 [Streptomyces prunicolor]|uniref:hypothetical protein n=1 Tax=Streptomyces prunicolor TaxID=67348 RepID=UPI00370F9CFB